MARITQRQINLLKAAVDEVEALYLNGESIGKHREELMSLVADCRKALSVVRAMRKETTQTRPWNPYRSSCGEE